MKKATIKIEVLEDSFGNVTCSNEIEGEVRALMLGLAQAISDVKMRVPEENRADYSRRVSAFLDSLR